MGVGMLVTVLAAWVRLGVRLGRNFCLGDLVLAALHSVSARHMLAADADGLWCADCSGTLPCSEGTTWDTFLLPFLAVVAGPQSLLPFSDNDRAPDFS